VTAAVLDFVLHHPGCAHAHAQRQHYSDGFRHFILRLREEHADLPLEDFARLCRLPLPTLKPWLALPRTAPSSATDAENATPSSGSTEPSSTEPEAQDVHVGSAQIQTVLSAWADWHGSFGSFVDHIHQDFRVPMGRQGIAHVLEASGVRQPRQRKGRLPDELALRESFETFFPGAQWVGDGMQVPVRVGGETFSLNLQFNVDAYTGAVVGLSVRDHEDSAAVLEALQDGAATTGSPPLSQLLDNKPSNHAPEVADALRAAVTLLLRSTSGRPQNKAHVEGAFGLFSQTIPPLELDLGQSSRRIAHILLLLIGTTFARAINRRPRADRGGRSRADLYADSPTDEQVAQARQALEERCRQQEQARATLEARQRPEVRALLDDHFARLGLLDPKRHVRLAIGRYPLDAIVDGIALFTAKRQAGTLPEGVDARYLLGIVRNLAAQREGERLAETLLAQRLEARDHALAHLEAERLTVCNPARADRDAITACVARALGTERQLDRLFWLQALVTELERPPHPDQRLALFRVAARQINTTFQAAPRERQNALCFLADRLLPLD
jgi:hypothetical protein